MAEVLGPLGMCLAGLGFILGTVPAAAKVTHSYREQKKQIVGMDNRLGLCQSKFSTWETYWQSSGLQENQALIQSSIRDIVGLYEEINNQITKYTRSTAETTAWRKMKERIRDASFRKPRLHSLTSSEFCQTVRYALWKKEILEGWMTRLEKAIDVIAQLFERDFHDRTAQHFDGGPTPKQVAVLEQLEEFSGALMSVATEIYKECTNEPNTCAWALAMPTPAEGKTILDWEVITPIIIQMRFSTLQQEDTGHFCLHVCFQQDDPDTHDTSSAVAELIRCQISGPDEDIVSMKKIECHAQGAGVKTTEPIGILLRQKPHLFYDPAWLVDRAELIYGICEWALRLWNTPWFEQLCCSGIVMEIGLGSVDCSNQTFRIKRHKDCYVRDHRSRLRNLGLVWAQLVLGYPVRFAGGPNLSKFEKFVDGTWVTMYRSEINNNVLKTGSLAFQEAIDFCLRPDSLSWSEQFKHGHLYRYMEQIFKPIQMWYRIESRERNEHPHGSSSKSRWPQEAIYTVCSAGN
ncbi:hypothetical protein HBI54_026610 [Parastagonospora nodorum]|nr:hypothetical protein HBI78_005270 [Parastagonospora nodorum]KAH6053060.1 hypothetical protein HBI54_026610 [Parastagonospora nodorum]